MGAKVALLGEKVVPLGWKRGRRNVDGRAKGPAAGRGAREREAPIRAPPLSCRTTVVGGRSSLFVGRRGRFCDTPLRAPGRLPRRAAATPDFTYFMSTMLRDSTPSSWARR